MFRSLNEDDVGGFVNEGLEVSESCDDKQSNNALSATLKDATEIQITRSSYDLKKLHEEMNYKQPQSKSSEFFFQYCLPSSEIMKLLFHA